LLKNNLVSVPKGGCRLESVTVQMDYGLLSRLVGVQET
jgi:hypothetical protein